MKLTKVQAKRALTEWNKAISTSTFWAGLQEAIKEKAIFWAILMATERGSDMPERLYRLQGKYEALHMDFERIIKNYVEYLEKESD